METKQLMVLLAFMTNLVVNAQDLITKRNGEDIKAKVMEVTVTEIKFKKTDNPDGPLFTLPKTEILIIRYENGEKDIFEAPVATIVNTPYTSIQDYYHQGELDAQKYYKGYRGYTAGTFVPSIFIGPLLGLLPAIGNSTSSVKEKHLLNDNHPELFKNSEYYDAYTKKAKKIKSRKVWGGYLGGSLLFVGVTLGVYTALTGGK